MPLKLINRKEVPSNGYWVVHPTTGRKFGGMFSFNYVSNQYLAYLIGNSLPGATKAETDDILDSQTCSKDPARCYDPGSRVAEQQRGSGGCSGCGIKVT